MQLMEQSRKLTVNCHLTSQSKCNFKVNLCWKIPCDISYS